MPRQHIIIAGNIGVGKSTLTQTLSDALGWQPFLEAYESNPYLADFYQDMGRWGFHSQVFFLSRRVAHHRALMAHAGSVVQDRSLYEDAEIFARNLYLQGGMSERDYATYQGLYEAVVGFMPPPTLVIYLHAPASVLLERILQRGRDYEKDIPLAYLERLNTLYDAWAAAWTLSPLVRVSVVERNFTTQPAELMALNAQIMPFLA